MNSLKVIITVLTLVLAGTIQAQVAVNVTVGSPPMWGPVGYSEARYYYLPDVEAYYDVPSSMFIYQSGGVWIHRKYLPARYRSYDLYNGYKVVMTDYHGNKPYSYHKDYKRKYAKGYRGPAQKNIGTRNGNGNSEAKQNARHYAKGKSVKHDANNQNGRGKSNGKKK